LGEVIEERIGFLRSLYTPQRCGDELAICMVDVIGSDWAKLLIIYRKRGEIFTEKPYNHDDTSRKCSIFAMNGIGMDEITLMHIYDRYYQNDSTMPGYGIGLNLVKRYCDRYGITLHIASKH
jgi:two-component system, OmpR family, sensor kinase